MKLGLAERFFLIGILPTEDDYATLRMSWLLKMSLSPTAEEYKEFEIEQHPESGMITWNDAGKAYIRDIPMNDPQTTLVRQILVDLDKKKKLNISSFSLFEKFVLEYQQG